MKIKYFLTFIFLHFINTNILFPYDDHLHVTLNVFQSNQQESNQDSNKIKFSANYSDSSNNNTNNDAYQEVIRNKAIQVAYFQCLSRETIEHLCELNEEAVLFEQHHLYSNPSYFNYLKSRTGYSHFILKLHKEINANHKFRESLRYMQGFKGRDGFIDFINQEANRIRQQIEEEKIERLERLKRNNQNLNISKISPNNFNESFCYSNDDIELLNRLKKRKEALSASLNQNEQYFDYSNQVKNYKFTDSNAEFFNYCYGSMMDKQLHEELCEIRQSAMNLQTQYHDENVEAFSGMILHFTALAKVQPSANVAFHLSDFSYYLLKAEEILVDGTKLGLKNSVKPFIHPIDNFFKPLGCAGIALGMAVFELVNNALEDPTGITNPIYVIQKATELSCSLVNYVKENPKEGVATIVELLVPVGISKFAKLKQVSSAAQKFKKITQASEYFEIASNAIKSVANPIKTILRETAETLKIGLEQGKDALRNVIKVIKGEPELVTVGDLAALSSPEHFKDVKKLTEVVSGKLKTLGNEANKRGKAFEDFLVKKLGGKGSFKITSKINGTREFDGVVGKVWYEAKSGKYWNKLLTDEKIFNDFKANMGRGLRIANENGATYELYSNTPIPTKIKDWLIKKGIPFSEFPEGL